MSLNHLQLAQKLTLPSREAMLHRSPSVQQFWSENNSLLMNAWRQWQDSECDLNLILDSSLLDDKLQKAVKQAWLEPSKESAVQDLLKQVAPGVYEFQLFNPERLVDLRAYIEKVWDAQIPIRAPYGIVLNRRGAMLDNRSVGNLAAPGFQAFYRDLLNSYMRPIARMLFPEIVGFDTQTFGFSIHYTPSTDTSIRTHTDASSVTLNVNLNLPGEEFSGSEVNFLDNNTGNIKRVTFKPGIAIIHRGHVAHAAQPIMSGERTNFVFWLYGDQGSIPPFNARQVNVDAKQRWTKVLGELDNFSPF